MIQMPKMYAERRAIDTAEIRDFLKEELGCESVPASEGSLSFAVSQSLRTKRRDYYSLKERYEGNDYPGRDCINESIRALDQLLRHSNDNKFLQLVSNNLSILKNNMKEMKPIELFYQLYADLYAEAVKFMKTVGVDFGYLEKDDRASDSVKSMRTILGDPIDYSRIAEVRSCIDSLRPIHEEMLDKKREEVCSVAKQCMGSIHTMADSVPVDNRFVHRVDSYYSESIKRCNSLNTKTITALAEIEDRMMQYENDCYEKLRNMNND